MDELAISWEFNSRHDAVWFPSVKLIYEQIDVLDLIESV
jgi:hypothetical protein